MTRGQAIAAALSGAALAVAAAIVVRFEFIEPAAMGQACIVDAAGRPWWCPLRDALVIFFRNEGFGWASLIAAVTALIARNRLLGVLAVVLGGAGMVLYNAGLAAVSILLGLLRVVRR